MQAVGYGQRQLQHRHFRKITGVENHQIRSLTCTVPHQIQHPAIIFCLCAGTPHHHRLTHKATGRRTPGVGCTGVQIKLLDGLQGIIARLPLSHRHPGVASAQPLPLRIHHGELAGALADPLGLHSLATQIKAASVQRSLRHRVEIDLGEVIVWADRGEVVVDDALHHHVVAILKSVEVMKHEAIGSFEDAGLLACELT